MRFYFKRRLRIFSNLILATTEYGDIVSQNGIITIPYSCGRYIYNYNTDVWRKVELGQVKSCTSVVSVEYINFVVKSNTFFTMLLKNEAQDYTPEERQNVMKDYYRDRRDKICYPVVNRGQLWYDHLTTKQKTLLNDWYEAWLDVTRTLIEPRTPGWINDTLNKIELDEVLL